MSIVGWARIFAGSALLTVACVASLMWDGLTGFGGIYYERLEYFGQGFDELILIPVPPRLILLGLIFLLGYRLLRNAEGVVAK